MKNRIFGSLIMIVSLVLIGLDLFQPVSKPPVLLLQAVFIPAVVSLVAGLVLFCKKPVKAH